MGKTQTIEIEEGGKFTLPRDVQVRYGFSPDTTIRVIETQSGILLVPLTSAPMSEALEDELSEWQALGAQSLQIFPYEDE